MNKHMEYVKCIALLGKALRMGFIDANEYSLIKHKLMDRYMIIQENGTNVIRLK